MVELTAWLQPLLHLAGHCARLPSGLKLRTIFHGAAGSPSTSGCSGGLGLQAKKLVFKFKTADQTDAPQAHSH